MQFSPMGTESGHSGSARARRAGRAISYEVIEGGSARLVLIAGTGQPGAYWKVAQGSFAEWATCVVIDNAGAGSSDPLEEGDWSIANMALDVSAVLDELGWQSAHIAGHSLGSAIAIWLGVTQPERVLSLSLHSTWSATSRAPHLQAWLEARQATSAVKDPSLWMRYAFFLVSPDHFASHGFTGGALGAVGAVVADVGHSAHVGQYSAGLDHDAADQLATLNMPTLVTVGMDDFITLPEYGRAVAKGIRGARFVEFPGTGHLSAIERPELFNETQRRFIMSLEAEGQRE